MSPRLFLTSLLAVNLSIQFLRLPHLILENGGGAFLILLVLSLHTMTLPLLIAETAITQKLRKLDFKSLIYLSKSKQSFDYEGVLLCGWFGLRFLILLGLLWYFLYILGNSLLYTDYFLKFLYGQESYDVIDTPAFPDMQLSYGAAMACSTVTFLIYFFAKKKFFRLSAGWLLPFSFITLLVLFIKIVISVQDFQSLKALLYPDFTSLSMGTWRKVVGHTLICLLIGVGFYDVSLFKENRRDPIEIFVRAIIQTLFLCLLVGVMAVPMIEKVNDLPFGSNWIFEILPRWLSYSQYGNYYCFLFFVAIGLIALYICVMFTNLISRNLKLLFQATKPGLVRYLVDIAFVVINGLVVILIQSSLKGWAGQSLFIQVDSFLVDGMVPLLALIMLWIVFRYTSKSERMRVFEKQQVLFHSRAFFRTWEWVAMYFVPTIIILAWFLGS